MEISTDSDIDKDRHVVDKLVDEFIELVEHVLKFSHNKESLFKNGFVEKSSTAYREIFNEVREFISTTNNSSQLLLRYYDFENHYKKSGLSDDQVKLFLERIKLFLSDRSFFTLDRGILLKKYYQLSNREIYTIFDDLKLTELKMMRINIDGSWTVDGLYDFTRNLESCYLEFLSLYLVDKYQFYFKYSYEIRNTLIGSSSQLSIVEIQYASPGHIDLLGFGKVFEQVIAFVNKLLHWRQNMRVEKLKLLTEEIIALKEAQKNLNALGLNEIDKGELDKLIQTAANAATRLILDEYDRPKLYAKDGIITDIKIIMAREKGNTHRQS